MGTIRADFQSLDFVSQALKCVHGSIVFDQLEVLLFEDEVFHLLESSDAKGTVGCRLEITYENAVTFFDVLLELLQSDQGLDEKDEEIVADELSRFLLRSIFHT